MSKYNSFYFLHVPKTGGRFLTKYIIDPIKENLENKNIQTLKNETINNDQIRNRHVGWHYNISPETYIVSCFREPVEWACSYFIHIMYIESGALDLNNEAIVINNVDKKFTGRDLINWLTENPALQNYQSKNFIYGAPKGSSIKHEIINKDNIINKAFLYKRLNRVNLLFRQSELKNMDYNILIKKISSDIGVDIDYKLFGQEDKQYYSNPASKLLYDSLSANEIDEIRQIMSVDIEIYSDDSLYWSI